MRVLPFLHNRLDLVAPGKQGRLIRDVQEYMGVDSLMNIPCCPNLKGPMEHPLQSEDGFVA
jgi:hypothetical protein